MPVRRVTDVLSLSKPVPFVDVDVDKDSRLFLDPSAIRVARRGGDRYAVRADAQLVEFFTEIIACARATNSADQVRGLRLLQAMHEPNETRLGYSTVGSRGHAFADEMGSRLWDEILANRTLKSGSGTSLNVYQALLSRLEHLPLFIDGVDRDMISDMATRIVFDVLQDFTMDMIRKYPSIGSHMTKRDYPVWDGTRGDLIDSNLALPSVDGKPLLLVPRNWVYWRTAMAARPFYNRYATQVLQDEQTTYGSDGRAIKPSKDSIKKQNKAVKETNAREAAKYFEQRGRNLVEEYEQEIDREFKPLDSDEIERRV